MRSRFAAARARLGDFLAGLMDGLGVGRGDVDRGRMDMERESWWGVVVFCDGEVEGGIICVRGLG